MSNLFIGLYRSTNRDNQKYVALINRAWGEEVAWIEDRETVLKPLFRNGRLVSPGMTVTLPVIVSRLVRGMLPGKTPPPFCGSAAEAAARK